MTTLFIADTHLSEAQPEITRLFMDFLAHHTHNADALYILGDLFEIWIGDDHKTPFNQSIIDALRTLSQTGLPIYIMHGNRDFLLGKRFFKATGCQFLKDPTVIDLYGVPTLLSHGDLFCTRDPKYLAFRKKCEIAGSNDFSC